VNPKIAQMFAMRFFEGKDNPEIAQLLNTTPGTVAVTLSRTPWTELEKEYRAYMGGRGMNPSEFNPIDPALERAMKEIRDDAVDPAVIEAAASRGVGEAAGAGPGPAHPQLLGLPGPCCPITAQANSPGGGGRTLLKDQSARVCGMPPRL
jgi:hypothetical protein